MKKQIIPIILGILLIGIVSAGVTITPSSISINAFPGETHQVNITIKADGNYLLIFNSTDSKITITPESMATINGEIKTKINLTFAKDISLGVHTFDVKGSTEVITVEVPVYRKGRTRYIEKEVEKIIGNETDEHGCLLMAGYTWCEPKQRCIRAWEEECIAEDAKKLDGIILGLIITCLLLITFLIITIKKIKKQKKEVKE